MFMVMVDGEINGKRTSNTSICWIFVHAAMRFHREKGLKRAHDSTSQIIPVHLVQGTIAANANIFRLFQIGIQ